MTTSRRFLLASSLARLIQRDKGGVRVIEGYFLERDDRTPFVEIEEDRSFLVLRTDGQAGPFEEYAEIPQSHAEALLNVAAGSLEYIRTTLSLGLRKIQLYRLTAPEALHLISVVFDREDEARAFSLPAWFGPEVTGDARYTNQSLALRGVHEIVDVPVSGMALHGLLDTLENRPAVPRQHPAAPQSVDTRQQSRPATIPPPPEATSNAGTETSDDEEELIRELARTLQPQRKR